MAAIMVIYAKQGARKSQTLAKAYQHRLMNLARRADYEARNKQTAAKGGYAESRKKLHAPVLR